MRWAAPPSARPGGARGQDRAATGGRQLHRRMRSTTPPSDEMRARDDVGPCRAATRRWRADRCARSPTWSPRPASGARPSSRCTWKSTSASCVRPGRQHRAASAGRRAQGARQRAAREAQRLDRQALDGGAEQDAGRAHRSARCSASGRPPRCATPEASSRGGGAAAVSRCRDHQRAAAAGQPKTTDEMMTWQWVVSRVEWLRGDLYRARLAR